MSQQEERAAMERKELEWKEEKRNTHVVVQKLEHSVMQMREEEDRRKEDERERWTLRSGNEEKRSKEQEEERTQMVIEARQLNKQLHTFQIQKDEDYRDKERLQRRLEEVISNF